MTEATNVDATNLEGAGENQSPVSQEQAKSIAGAPSNSQELLELRKQLELTRAEMKGLQSRQDKEKNEVQRFMEDVKAQMAKGKSLEEAEQAVHESRKATEKDELLYKIAQKVGVLDGSPQNVAGNGRNAADEVANVFAEYDVPLNDPEAASLMDMRGVDLVKGVSKLALKRKSNNIVDSSEAPSIGSAPVGSRDTDAIDSQIAELSKNYTQNKAKIEALMKQRN